MRIKKLVYYDNPSNENKVVWSTHKSLCNFYVLKKNKTIFIAYRNSSGATKFWSDLFNTAVYLSSSFLLKTKDFNYVINRFENKNLSCYVITKDFLNYS